MANLLTPALLAAIDWDEYQRNGRELSPSTVDWIKQNGKPNIEFEFLVLQKAIERSERVRRSKFHKKYQSLPKKRQKSFLWFLKREHLIPRAELAVITGLKDYQIKYILYKDGGPLDEEGN